MLEMTVKLDVMKLQRVEPIQRWDCFLDRSSLPISWGMRSSRMSKFEVDDKGKAKEMPSSLYNVYDVSDEA